MSNIILRRGVALAEKLKEDPGAIPDWWKASQWMREQGFPSAHKNSLYIHNSRRWRLALEASAEKGELCLLHPLDEPSLVNEVEQLCKDAIQGGARTWEAVAEKVKVRSLRLRQLHPTYLPHNLLFWSLVFNWDTPGMSREFAGSVPFSAQKDEIGKLLTKAITNDPQKFHSWSEVADWISSERGLVVSPSALRKENNRSWNLHLELSCHNLRPTTQPKGRQTQGTPSEYLAVRNEIHRIFFNIIQSNPRRFQTWREVTQYFNENHPHLKNRYGDPLTLSWFYQQNHRHLWIDLPQTYALNRLVRT